MLDRPTLRALRTAMQKTLDEHLDFDGVAVEVGSASFAPDGSNATFKLVVSTTNSDGTVNTKIGEDFKRNAVRWGLAPDDLGREFSSGADTYEIVGAKPRSPKYPILAKCKRSGKTFKFHPNQVKAYLAIPT